HSHTHSGTHKMDLKLFELNGINLTPFSHKITNLQIADAEALNELGIEIKFLAEISLGVRTITWIGNITDEATYLRFRKELFGPGSKILKLNPNRQINITGLKAEDNLDMKDASKTSLTLTLFAADPLDYSALESTAQITVINEGDQITVTNSGEAPTIPEWDISAINQIIDPSITDAYGNTLGWTGIVDSGDVLVFRRDGTVTLNGINTGSATGSVLRFSPGSTVITYNDDVNSSHSCMLKATWRDAFY
ncbi:MAG: hypothetical protein Q7U60_07185, partial [Candidatus Methanoperedens sp.]|nr:hypothetical protein [Candidatus Methanoperedens sp.]